MAALVGGVVGAVIAALVASGLVLATDDDRVTTGGPSSTTAPPASGGASGTLDIQQLLEAAQPSVVSINLSVGGQPVSAGTGFVVDESGLIVTNAHVIDGAEDISVTFFDGSALGAELVGAFPDDDVAMVRVDGKEGLEAATLGSSEDLRVGEDVVAIGNALGLGGKPSVTLGIVSAKDRDVSAPGIALQDLIQTDAAINPGNSGGPLFNADNEVVGINTVVAAEAQNIGFALAIDSVRPLIDDLRDGGGDINPDQAFLGTSTVPVSSPDIPPEVLDQFGITGTAGLLVTAVTTGSAADEAGLEIGDVIVDADGESTDSTDVLSGLIRNKQPGDDITLTTERAGQAREITVTLGRRGG